MLPKKSKTEGMVWWKSKKGQYVKIKPDPYKIASFFYGKDHDVERNKYYDELATNYVQQSRVTQIKQR